MKVLILFCNLYLASFTLSKLAPLHSSKNAIPGEYIITLKSNTRITMYHHIELVKSLFETRIKNNKIVNVYSNLGTIYHAKLTPEVLNKVRKLPEVDFIEYDGIATIQSIQNNSTWGLARISQRAFINKNTYNYDGDGSGVTVYVIDSGIQINHPEFEGRAKWGANFVSNSSNEDERGHGTHCAGTVGSKSYGVAKNVELVAVKVISKEGAGPWSGIIAGVDWVVGDKRGIKGNIMSMSLGGYKNEAVNKAVNIAAEKGILPVIAAMNNNDDTCSYSPASAVGAFTVAASDINDSKASFSNYGKCISIIAPGVNILSTWNNMSTKLMNGTSMATPHVAGLAAIFYSKGKYTVPEIKSYIQSVSTKNTIIGFDSNTVNNLLYNNVN